MPRVLLSAFGIHTGGGRVLLEDLLRELGRHLKAASLDVRMRGVDVAAATTEFVPVALLARLRSLRALAARADAGDVLFCFNGLPPLRKPAGARVVLYMQGRHLLEREPGVRYSLRTALRVAFERCWLRLGVRHCDEMWVQTPTMAALAKATFPGLQVRVLPFVDAALAARLPPVDASPRIGTEGAEASFFYPADGVAHKNHAVLVRAWQLLARQDCRPVLYLTLHEHEFARCVGSRSAESRIVNLGLLARPDVLARMASSSALIFPSTVESFGLPLLEARSLGKPILAAERDFVRDVCEPVQTFDPASPRSIADAVRRFLAPGARQPLQVLSAREFARELAA